MLWAGGQCRNDPVSHPKYLTVKLYQVIFMLGSVSYVRNSGQKHPVSYKHKENKRN